MYGRHFYIYLVGRVLFSASGSHSHEFGNECGPHFWNANERCDLFIHRPGHEWHIYRSEDTFHLYRNTGEHSMRCAHRPCVLVCFHERQ